MHRDAFFVTIMAAVSIVLLQLFLFSRGFQAEIIELQILAGFEIVLLILHSYHFIFLMHHNEVRTLHELTKPPHTCKSTLYFSIITLLDTLVASYSLNMLVNFKRGLSQTKLSIFELPYGIIVLVNVLMGILVTGLLLFLFTHYIYHFALKCKPNLHYRKIRVLSVIAMMIVDLAVLIRFFSQRHDILNNLKVLGGEVAKNGFLNFFVMSWSIILYLRRPGYEVFLSFCFFICLAIYSSDFFFLLRNFFYEVEENRQMMFGNQKLRFTKFSIAYIFMATVSIIEVTIFTLQQFMTLIKNSSMLNHLPQDESKRLYKIKARYVESMILTWPEVIGYINLYLTSRRLYAFILMLVALMATQIMKHFMIRRNMGAGIQLNFPNNQYKSKASAQGIILSGVTQTVFIVAGVVIVHINYENTTLYKLNYIMSVLLLVLSVLLQFIGYRRTHLHILSLVGMERAPIPVAIHPNSGIPDGRFDELVEVTHALPDDDVCNICLDEMAQNSEPERQDTGENFRYVVRIKACMHKFHKACLQQWSMRKSTCPKCRISMMNPPALPHAAPLEEQGEGHQTEANSNIVMIPQANS